MSKILNPNDYTVAWIAVLPIEAKAALASLDRLHDGHFESGRRDDYIYTAGEVNGHNVVVATWPAGQNYGLNAASSLANQVKYRFHNLWFALLVGVGAGLPNHTSEDPDRRRDIRLGDVLVCLPRETHTGVVQYDLGRDTEDGFVPNSRQAETPQIVRAAIGDIRLKDGRAFKQGGNFAQMLSNLQDSNEANEFGYPGQGRDLLHTSDGTEVITRTLRDESERTVVWYGFLGSGNSLMRNSTQRDLLRDKYDLIGLEMEAAGVINVLPSGVIRGVCDYADGFKSKEWQGYAAAVAAVYARGVLCRIRPEPLQTHPLQASSTVEPSISTHEIKTQSSRDKVITDHINRSIPAAVNNVYEHLNVSGTRAMILGNVFSADALPKMHSLDQQAMALRSLYYSGMQSREDQIRQQAGSPNSIDWIWSTSFSSWLGSLDLMYWITGLPGTGKSCLMSHVARSSKTREKLQETGKKWTVVDFYFDFRAGRGMPNRLDGLFYSMLHQMVQKLPTAAEKVDTQILSQKDPIPIHKLFDIGSDIIASADSNVCMFIDGLDEYQGSAIELLEAINSFADQAPPKLKICLASRPEPIFLEQLGQLEHLFLQDFNQQGIDFYINNVWRSQQLDVQAKLPQELGGLIRSRALGNFLWARLATDETMQGLLAGKSVEELKQNLSDMPHMIEEMYEQILRRLSKIVLVEALILLRLISEAGGGIWIGKLYAGLAAVRRDAHLQDQIMDIDTSADNTSRLLSILGSFLDIRVESEKERRTGSGIRFASSKLLADQHDSIQVRFTHATLQKLCSKSHWIMTKLPSTFKELYPDNIWLRLFAYEISCCHVSDDTLAIAISKGIDEFLASLYGKPSQRTDREWRKYRPIDPCATCDSIMTLLRQWPHWTTLLPYALEGFWKEAQDALDSQEDVYALYECAVQSSAFMLHCPVYAYANYLVQNQDALYMAVDLWRSVYPYAKFCSRPTYDHWRPHYTTTPPPDSWATYAAVCHNNWPAVAWHLQHDITRSSTSYNPQALVDGLVFDSRWPGGRNYIRYSTGILKTLVAQGATFDSRHACILTQVLYHWPRNDFFATIYDLMNQHSAAIFDRDHMNCSLHTVVLSEPVTQAKWMVAHWSASHFDHVAWKNLTKLRPLLDKSLSTVEQKPEATAELLSIALKGCMQISNGEWFAVFVSVLEHRMFKVTEIIREAVLQQVRIDCQSAISDAKALRASFDSWEIENDTTATIRSYLREEATQIIDLLKIFDAHQFQIPNDLARYEKFNCWYEASLDRRKPGSIDNFFLLLGSPSSYRRIGPFPYLEAIRRCEAASTRVLCQLTFTRWQQILILWITVPAVVVGVLSILAGLWHLTAGM